VILLSSFDLAIAAGLIVLLALLSWRLRLGQEKALLIAATRTTVQLLLIGWVLKALFAVSDWYWVALMALVMWLAAGREASARQRRPLAGGWGFGVGTASMFVSSLAVTVLALLAIVQPDPWYTPQYAIPLLGMLLGNTMNGIALGLDRLTVEAWDQRETIEARLLLGQSGEASLRETRREAMRTGMIPIVNAMAAAGIVSLPGMMTGQILAGAPPIEAVKYQILIMFLITVGTGLGTIAAVWLGSRRLFDARERLRLDRIGGGGR